MSVNGQQISLNAEKDISVASERVQLSTAWKGEVRMDPSGGVVKAGNLEMSGNKLTTNANDLIVSAPQGMSVNAPEMMLDAEYLQFTAKQIRHEADKIRFSTSWNVPVQIENGDLAINKLVLSNSGLSSTDDRNGLLLSGAGVSISSASAHGVSVAGQSVDVAADEAIKLEAPTISFRTEWAKPVIVDPRGSALQLHGLQMSGNQLTSADDKAGLVLSAPNHVNIESAELQLSSHNMRVEADAIALKGKRIKMSAEWNSNIEFEPRGSAMNVAGILINNAGLQSVDTKLPLMLDASNEMQISAVNEISLVSDAVNVKATLANVQAEKIALSTQWNGDVALNANGGNVQIAGLQFAANQISSADEKFGLLLSSKKDIRIMSDDDHSVSFSGNNMNVEASEQVLLQSEKDIVFSTGSHGRVKLDSPDGIVFSRQFEAHGSRLNSKDSMAGLVLRSDEDFHWMTKNGTIQMQAEDIALQSTADLRFAGAAVQLSTDEWQGDVKISTKSAPIHVAALDIEGNSIQSHHAMADLQFKSDTGIHLAAATNNDVLLTGSEVHLRSAEATSITADSVTVDTAWNKVASMQTTGGEVKVEGMSLSGSMLSYTHPLHGGAAISSRGFVIESDQLQVTADAIVLSAQREISLSADSISLQPEWNKDMDLNLRGGHVSVGKLKFDGSSFESLDQYRGASLASSEDIVMATGESKQLRLSGGDMSLMAREHMNIQATALSMNAGWNKAIHFNTPGGAVRYQSVQISGTRIHSSDQQQGLQLRADEDVVVGTQGHVNIKHTILLLLPSGKHSSRLSKLL